MDAVYLPQVGYITVDADCNKLSQHLEFALQSWMLTTNHISNPRRTRTLSHQQPQRVTW